MSFCSIGRAVTYFEKLNVKIGDILRRANGRPIYLGRIADEIQWSPERTREFLQALNVRKLTLKECAELDVPHPWHAELYVM